MKQEIVVITGAFGALGRAVARTLSARGLRMALLDVALDTPRTLAESHPDALLLSGYDLVESGAATTAMAKVAEHFGAIHGLVNVAGGFQWETIETGDPATWRRMFDVNVMTAANASRAALPHLRAAENGRIVNVGAAAAAKAEKGMGPYAASKAGVLRLTEALAHETKDLDIRVNAVLPSIIDTSANRRAMPQADWSRWVAPEALADVIAFLLSDGARAVTGAAIPVTGKL